MTLPLRINLHGGSGVGKSALAARLFADLKAAGIEKLELVKEWIKQWAWEGKTCDEFDQCKVFGEQLYAEHSLLKLGVSLITDSPIQMQIPYVLRSKEKSTALLFARGLTDIASSFDKRWSHIDFFVDRSFVFKQADGRYEDLNGAKEMDLAIVRHLGTVSDGNFFVIKPVKDYDFILRTCKKALSEQCT